ncbi:MAG TPA: 2-dehydropantoate 2-reductase [Terriglobia bacterium]|nr:2-dehydropantoate 2-reductase [Terriglobia bacterium]
MSGATLVWGAGAIGGTIGAALIRDGEEVLFVDQDAQHVAAINARGLSITGPIDAHQVRAKALLPSEVTGSYARILLAVKAHHTAAAMAALIPHLDEDGVVVSLQNGLNERVIAAAAGRQRTLGAFVNFGADYLEPGIVLYGGRGAVVVGELDGRRSARAERLHRQLLGFDRDAILTENIWGFLWSKLIYGALLFATAVTNDSIADVLALQRYRPVLTALAHEVARVAAAEGIRLEAFNGFDPAAFQPDAPISETMRSFDEMVAHNRRSAKSHSGIWRDLAVRKRKTEVDAQIGPVVEIGRLHGIPTPLCAKLIDLIHRTEDAHRQLELAGLDELAQAAGMTVQPA